MPDRVFVDTNIFVYAYDTHDAEKQRRAQDVMRSGIESESIVLSVQVLGEFFTVVTKRIPSPLSVDEAEDVLNLVSILPIVEIDRRMVHRAIETHRRYRITYWDSLIVAAAERAGCTQILSEDLNAGQSYNGIVVVNPFSEVETA